MSRKSKGINAERDLIHKFWDKGWGAIRVAGSGSSRYPSPDILAGNNIRKLAIECKVTKEPNVYIKKEQITDLSDFSRIFGAEPWIAVRLQESPWHFITIEDTKETDSNFLVNMELIKNRGLLFEELLNA